MAQYGRRGISYTPFFAEAMGDVTDALSNRRDRQKREERNAVASQAWMGDPMAMQQLAELDPDLAMKVETQAAKRDETQLQRGLDKDARFTEDFETAMMQIGSFSSFEEAQAYGQRMTDMLLQKYPDRLRQQGFPEQFNEESFNEIRTITGGTSGEPVGVPFRAVDAKGRAVMAQQTKLKNGRTITKYLEDESGALIRPAEYDAGLAYDLAGAKKEAVIDLADEEALAKLSADAKTQIMPARKSAQQTIGMISAMKNHPGLDSVVGVGWLNPAKFVPGTEAHNFQILAEQAQGKVFSQAYETLKGGGPITEFESRKAGQAIARMETSQSKPEYLAALNDFETAVRDGYGILLKQARGEFETDVELPGRIEGAEQYTRSNPATPTDEAAYNALPSGSHYRAPDGSIKKKR